MSKNKGAKKPLCHYSEFLTLTLGAYQKAEEFPLLMGEKQGIE